ncbi:putative nucleic acid-binding protein, contains PIN domain [Metallosphaera yellowstonensis MK1]|uniref:Putative nucleic acid-binding protein, contains PIN domain n=1 Tax=Metallosphaera yellowstonensis MK1 TaxID=671065 RepID=H2C501_9CREN|nr:type II toxin-antitoxin system VapC family toxin [Metallosphaera yellowstonensis]EHP71092.1 putative nucleic acid-binding protein, contains PIN domain [Metallosphaera yellowstonensis MK1]
MRVIDSSSLVKFFSREKGWEKVAEVITEGVMTLDLAIKEVASALWKKVLRGEMKEEVAINILSDLIKREAMLFVKQDDYLIEGFKIANRNKITVYDSLFIALAKLNNFELVTSDKKQYEIAAKEGLEARLI